MRNEQAKHGIVCTQVYYSAIKNELLIPAAIGMNLKAKDVRYYWLHESGSSSVKCEAKSNIYINNKDWQLSRAQKEDKRVMADELGLASLNNNNILTARMVRQFSECSKEHQITSPSCHCLVC